MTDRLRETLRRSRRGWMDHGLCAQTDPEAFFPEKGASPRQAITVCRHCDVAAQCLDHALAFNERHGVWGGATPEQRRELARRGHRAA